jgi:hypothetical protein
LTLKLSSPSFLDSNVNDGLSDNPLYTIKTGSTSTTVLRYDPWAGNTEIADIRWPQRMPLKGKGKEDLQGVIVQVSGGEAKAVEQFLKFGTLSGCVVFALLRCMSIHLAHSSRRFVIPNYPHTFKWRRSGSSYHVGPAVFRSTIIIDLFCTSVLHPP